MTFERSASSNAAIIVETIAHRTLTRIAARNDGRGAVDGAEPAAGFAPGVTGSMAMALARTLL
jgi:hypothetical protein